VQIVEVTRVKPEVGVRAGVAIQDATGHLRGDLHRAEFVGAPTIGRFRWPPQGYAGGYVFTPTNDGDCVAYRH
jgi:hypothetical protein